jgi:hypothetical protein
MQAELMSLSYAPESDFELFFVETQEAIETEEAVVVVGESDSLQR